MINPNGRHNFTCVVCEQDIFGISHNAKPLSDGRCCSDCNTYVIIERVKQFTKNNKSKKPITNNKEK